MRQIFNEIIKQNEFTPEDWKKVKIKVIHKKCDVENVGNCRPICSLPALYKLFSAVLYGRLCPRLNQEQAEGRAGFRNSCQTTDHFATYRMIVSKTSKVSAASKESNLQAGPAMPCFTQTLCYFVRVTRDQPTTTSVSNPHHCPEATSGFRTTTIICRNMPANVEL